MRLLKFFVTIEENKTLLLVIAQIKRSEIIEKAHYAASVNENAKLADEKANLETKIDEKTAENTRLNNEITKEKEEIKNTLLVKETLNKTLEEKTAENSGTILWWFCT